MFDVKPGDGVTRWLAGECKMRLKVTEVTDTLICCGPYTFDRKSGYEIDEELGWGEKGEDGVIRTGSFITVE